MKEWLVKFVNAAAEEEILSLSPDLRAKFLHVVELLQEFGPQNVGLPHVRPIGDKIWEIRLKGRNNIARSMYVMGKARTLVILHTFIKKTQKTPAKNIKIAKTRLKELSDERL